MSVVYLVTTAVINPKTKPTNNPPDHSTVESSRQLWTFAGEGRRIYVVLEKRLDARRQRQDNLKINYVLKKMYVGGIQV